VIRFYQNTHWRNCHSGLFSCIRYSTTWTIVG